VVVAQEGGRTTLHKPTGTRYIRPRRDEPAEAKLEGSWTTTEELSTGDMLIVHDQGAWFSVWMLWDAGGDFGGHYINFERPWTRSRFGFDTQTLALDIVVFAEQPWRWKDRDEFDRLVELGLIAPEEQTAVLEAAVKVIREVENGAGVFGPEWRRPPPHSVTPVLPGEEWAIVVDGNEP
jgi:predicted RNA-binding protein associated with RNAse of E/G family